jgi:hypothetical protein
MMPFAIEGMPVFIYSSFSVSLVIGYARVHANICKGKRGAAVLSKGIRRMNI